MYLKSPDPTNLTMKAYRSNNFTSLDDLRLRDEDDPRPQRGEVVVRVHALPELPHIGMHSKPLVTEFGQSVYSTSRMYFSDMRPPCTLIFEKAVSISRRSGGVS